MMKNLTDMNFGIIAYFLVGFGVMYGAPAGGLIGTGSFALQAGSYSDGVNAPITEGGSIPLGVDFLYQAVFCATAATIMTGGVAAITIVAPLSATTAGPRTAVRGPAVVPDQLESTAR